MFYKTDRLAVLIDGSYLGGASASGPDGFYIDFTKLREFFTSRGTVQRLHYFTGALPTGEDGSQPMRKLLDFIEFNGFKLSYTHEGNEAAGARAQGAVAAHIAVAALLLADAVDHVVIASCDQALIPAIAALQARGIRVSVMGDTIGNTRLRRLADSFVDLHAIRKLIELPPRERAAA